VLLPLLLLYQARHTAGAAADQPQLLLSPLPQRLSPSPALLLCMVCLRVSTGQQSQQLLLQQVLRHLDRLAQRPVHAGPSAAAS
jgi:hypothetical protein